MKELDNFYLKQEEPVKGCLLALRQIILSQDEEVTSAWKWGMPVFYYKGTMFCYVWFHKKYKKPYIGIVDGNLFDEVYLIQEKRAKMKIMLLDPHEDLPLSNINTILQKSLDFYRTGEIKTKE